MKNTVRCAGLPSGRVNGGGLASLASLLLLLLGLHAGLAGAAAALENYEFLPLPAVVKLGTSVTLTMAGCIDPAATAAAPPGCPAPTVLADRISAEVGTLRQTSPAVFVYTAPTVMPARPLVEIRASYQQPQPHDVLGMVMLIDPKLAASASANGAAAGSSGSRKPGSGAPKYLRYTGFVQVFSSTAEGPWLRNLFWLEADDDTRKSYGDPGGDDFLFVQFKRLVGSMSQQHFDPGHHYLQYEAGREVFDGVDEVFAHLSINLTRQLYGWQVHGDRLGDRPPSSSTYMDPGYNSSCGSPTFVAKEETLPYTDLTMLTGTLNCGKLVAGGEGTVMSWYFVPLFR